MVIYNKKLLINNHYNRIIGYASKVCTSNFVISCMGKWDPRLGIKIKSHLIKLG